MLLAPLSAHFFMFDLVSDSMMDPPHPKAKTADQDKIERKEFAMKLQHEPDPEFIKSWEQDQTLKGVIDRLSRVKFTAKQTIINFLCRFVRRRKGSAKIQKFMDFKTA